MKGELRQATQITIHEHQSWVYRHWYVYQTFSPDLIAYPLQGMCYPKATRKHEGRVRHGHGLRRWL